MKYGRTLGLILGSLLGSLFFAGLSPASVKKHKTAESYPAIEKDSEPAAPQPPAPVVVPAAPVAKAKVRPDHYDQVPEALKESLSDRIAVVGDILQRHNRAYDYRSLTVAQLKQILEALDDEAAKQSAASDQRSEASF